MIPTIEAVTIFRFSNGASCEIDGDGPADDMKLLVKLRQSGGPEVEQFFADLEDHRGNIEIRGNQYRWEEIAHIFHDLDGA